MLVTCDETTPHTRFPPSVGTLGVTDTRSLARCMHAHTHTHTHTNTAHVRTRDRGRPVGGSSARDVYTYTHTYTRVRDTPTQSRPTAHPRRVHSCTRVKNDSMCTYTRTHTRALPHDSRCFAAPAAALLHRYPVPLARKTSPGFTLALAINAHSSIQHCTRQEAKQRTTAKAQVYTGSRELPGGRG